MSSIYRAVVEHSRAIVVVVVVVVVAAPLGRCARAVGRAVSLYPQRGGGKSFLAAVVSTRYQTYRV
jgi:uncharacterized protein (DUF697 family)